MKNLRISSWGQVFASLGVFVGLLMVAYEIRESNRVATSEAVRGIEDCFLAVGISEYETDIAELAVKSVEEPEQLSSAERLKLNGWLVSTMTCYQRWLNMYQLGVARYDPLDDLRGRVDFYLGSEFGRAWFAENKSLWYPEMVEAIEAELVITPVRTGPPAIGRTKPEH
jgi:hypothetical protein